MGKKPKDYVDIVDKKIDKKPSNLVRTKKKNWS